MGKEDPMRRRITALAVVSLSLSIAAAAFAADAAPDATLELKGGSVAVGVGFSWGSGTLHYKGKTYNISADGFDVGDVGVTNITASGKVFNLKKLEDFNGNYTGVGAAGAVAGGGGAVVLQNQNGVKIELLSTTQGVKLAIAAAGVKIRIKD
jgi:hypothetical protein